MANVLVNDSSLSAIAAAIRAKNGQESTYKPAQMAGAIAALQTGGASLPELTTPAAAADILQGKEAVDGNGNKVTGTLQCLSTETVELQESPSISGIEPTLLISLESNIDWSSMPLWVPVPDAKPENIIAGKSILGVDGAAKKLVTASGTITPAADSDTITVSTGLADIKDILIMADVDNFISLPYKAAIKICVSLSGNTNISIPSVSEENLDIINSGTNKVVVRYNNAIGLAQTAISSATVDGFGSMTIILQNQLVFAGGQRYNWIAYGWED